MGNQVRGKGNGGKRASVKWTTEETVQCQEKERNGSVGCPDLLWRNVWFTSLSPTVKLEACHVCLYEKTGHSLLNSTTPSNNSCFLFVLSPGYQEFIKIDLLINIIRVAFIGKMRGRLNH